MSEGQIGGLIWGLGALVLVGSSLIARRLPLGQTLKLGLAWLAIFAAAFAAFALRHDARALWDRIIAADNPGRPVSDGGTMTLRRSDNGHFVVEARVNGVTLPFIVDTGATTTAMNRADAARAGIEVDESGFPVVLETANGVTTAWRARIDRFAIGGATTENLAITVGDGLGGVNLLGMNYLSALKSWRVEGDRMIFEP